MKLKLRTLTYRENYGEKFQIKDGSNSLDREVNDVQAIYNFVESMKIAITSLTQKMKNWKISQMSCNQ